MRSLPGGFPAGICKPALGRLRNTCPRIGRRCRWGLGGGHPLLRGQSATWPPVGWTGSLGVASTRCLR
eukprot:2778477-Alexandrium_andersonii.AAC.1